jgi:hypothetical protein
MLFATTDREWNWKFLEIEFWKMWEIKDYLNSRTINREKHKYPMITQIKKQTFGLEIVFYEENYNWKTV